MRILVTGAAGFIGSSLVDALLARGDTVIGVDNFDSFYGRGIKLGNLENALERPRFTLLEKDLTDPSALDTVEGSIDCIVHLAAKAGVRPSIEDPVGYYNANVNALLNLLEWSKRKEMKQFVFASSSSVYGDCKESVFREDLPHLRAISPYASTKFAGESMGHVYKDLYGIRFLALRFFTVFGPRQRPDLAIHKFTRMILQGDAIPFFGDGSTARDYTFVSDTVQGILGAISYQRSEYEIINLGNDRTITLNEMVETIEKALGTKARRTMLPDQPGDVPFTKADITKARKLISYSPAFSFADGIDHFVAWFQAGRSL